MTSSGSVTSWTQLKWLLRTGNHDLGELLRTLGISKVDYPAYLGYLSESEAELLRIGASKCNALHDQSQLSAVIFLLIRATSLFRSSLALLATGPSDAYDAVRRAYLETWLLAYEFRLGDSQPKTVRWHNRKSDSWSADIGRLNEYSKSQGITVPTLGKDYGGLSELAHPTKSAAENSTVEITALRGDPNARKQLIGAKNHYECEDVPMTMYRYLWMLIEERDGLIRIDADLNNLPTAHTYITEFAKALP